MSTCYLLMSNANKIKGSWVGAMLHKHSKKKKTKKATQLSDLFIRVSTRFFLVAWALASDLLTPNTPLTADNHSTPPDVTGLSERSSRHSERPQVASVRGVSRGYNHHTSVMETADGKFPAITQAHMKRTLTSLYSSCCLSVCLPFSWSVSRTRASCWPTLTVQD